MILDTLFGDVKKKEEKSDPLPEDNIFQLNSNAKKKTFIEKQKTVSKV